MGLLGCSDYSIIDKNSETIYVYLEDTSEPEVIYIEDTAEDTQYPIWTDSFTQVSSMNGVDIVWVVDRSGSMNNNSDKLENGIDTMMSILNTEFSVSWRIGIISADPNESKNNQTFPLVFGDDVTDAMANLSNLGNPGREQGFSAFYEYHQNSYAQTWMRQDAALLVVFVSDEDDQSQQAFPLVSDFTWWYSSLRPNVYLATITVTSTDCESQLGDRYMDSTSYFNGDIVDICSDDWSPSIRAVTERLQPFEEWELTQTPLYGESGIYIFINGQLSDDVGINWSYDATNNKVVFDPNTLPNSGDLVEISYEWSG